jgi:hypothetical protein
MPTTSAMACSAPTSWKCTSCWSMPCVWGLSRCQPPEDRQHVDANRVRQLTGHQQGLQILSGALRGTRIQQLHVRLHRAKAGPGHRRNDHPRRTGDHGVHGPLHHVRARAGVDEAANSMAPAIPTVASIQAWCEPLIGPVPTVRQAPAVAPRPAAK